MSSSSSSSAAASASASKRKRRRGSGGGSRSNNSSTSSYYGPSASTSRHQQQGQEQQETTTLLTEDPSTLKQNKGRGAKRSGTARSSHLAWVQKRQSQLSRQRQRLHMRIKQLRRKIKATSSSSSPSSNTATATLYCDLAKTYRSTDCMDEEECEAWRMAFESDPTHVDARRGFVLSLMNNADAAGAREICDKFETSDTGAAFSWSRALLEHLSFHVLGEAGASLERAQSSLRNAIESNPYVAFFIAKSEAFLSMVGPDTIDVLLQEKEKQRARETREARNDHGDDKKSVVDKKKSDKKRRKVKRRVRNVEESVAEGLEYCLTGISCWLDAPGGLEHIDQVLDTMAAEEKHPLRQSRQKCVQTLRDAETVLNDSESVPCTRLCERFLKHMCANVASGEKNDDDTKAEEAARERKRAKTDDDDEAEGKASATKTQSKSAKRRARAGYSRAVNRKKCIYGGNANDICVFVE